MKKDTFYLSPLSFSVKTLTVSKKILLGYLNQSRRMYVTKPQLFDKLPTATFPRQLQCIYISCNTLWMKKLVIKQQWHNILAGHTTRLSFFYFLHQVWSCLLTQGKGFWQVIENTRIIFILIWFDSCTNFPPRHAIRVSAHSTPSAVSFSPFFEL